MDEQHYTNIDFHCEPNKRWDKKHLKPITGQLKIKKYKASYQDIGLSVILMSEKTKFIYDLPKKLLKQHNEVLMDVKGG